MLLLAYVHARVLLTLPRPLPLRRNFYYGQGHPMKPHRIRVAHQLIVAYHMYKKMEILRPTPSTAHESKSRPAPFVRCCLRALLLRALLLRALLLPPR